MQTEPLASTADRALRMRMRGWLATFLPMPIPASARERIKGCLGALLGLVCTEWLSRHLLGGFNPWFVAPMGASAVLLFAVPASPLAQPWSIIGGNVVAAVVGVTCAQWIPDPGVAAAVAVALAIVLMFQLHCIHPPSGAVAITAVFGGPAITKLGYGFVVFPVALNSMLLLLVALSFNNLVRRRYPHRPTQHANPHGTRDPLPGERIGFTSADLDQVLAARGEFLDIDKDDLEEILVAAELRAYQRRFGDVRCQDIMSRDIVAIEADERLSVAWKLLTQHRLQVLPVISKRQGRLVGLLTLHDLFVARRGLPSPRQDGIVRDVMLTNVPIARAEQPMMELAHILSDGGLHQLPVVDDQRKLVGLVTQTDLIAALVKSRLMLKDA
jgi:CBS domain-containing membrane protein